jgi:hypothetical protein
MAAHGTPSGWTTALVSKVHRTKMPYSTLSVGPSDRIWVAFLFHSPSEGTSSQGPYDDLALAQRSTSGNWSTTMLDTRSFAGYRPDMQFTNNGELRLLYRQNLDLTYGQYEPSTGNFYREPVTESASATRNLSLQPDDSPVATHRSWAPSSGHLEKLTVIK